MKGQLTDEENKELHTHIQKVISNPAHALNYVRDYVEDVSCSLQSIHSGYTKQGYDIVWMSQTCVPSASAYQSNDATDSSK